MPPAESRIGTRLLAGRSFCAVLQLAGIGIGPDIYVQVAVIVQHDRLGLMLMPVSAARYDLFRLVGIDDIEVLIQFIPIYTGIRRGIEIAIAYSDPRSGKITESGDLIGLPIPVGVLQTIDALSVFKPCQFYENDPVRRHGNMPGAAQASTNVTALNPPAV